jgi:hypothetical protein
MFDHAAGLVLTRIVLRAHWASDVGAGLVIGGLTERLSESLANKGRNAVDL